MMDKGSKRAMGDFIKVFILILSAIGFYLGLFLLSATVNPFLLSLIGIVISAGMIIAGILYWKRRKKS